MPYNPEIERRISKLTAGWKNTDSRKMFGGVCHLFNGNIFCGVYKDYLILRLGEDRASQAAGKPFVKPFDITGKPMKGWVMVAEEEFHQDRQLNDWLESAKRFAETLPPKAAPKEAT